MTGVIPIAAREGIATLLKNADANHPIYIAWGNGTTDLSIYDTKLTNEVTRKAATVSLVSTNTYRLAATFTVTAAQAGTAAEAGIFDAAAGGIMFYHGGFEEGDPAGIYTCTERTIAEGDILSFRIEIVIVPSGGAIVSAGYTAIVNLLGDLSTPTAFGYVAYGAGTTAEATSQTALVSETARVAATVSIASVYYSRDTVRFVGVFAIGASPPVITEVGVFTALAAGTMLLRKLADNPFTPAANCDCYVVIDVPIRDGGAVNVGSAWGVWGS